MGYSCNGGAQGFAAALALCRVEQRSVEKGSSAACQGLAELHGSVVVDEADNQNFEVQCQWISPSSCHH